MHTVHPSHSIGKGKSGSPATQFKAGQSGNPAGRPKKEKCIPDALRVIQAEEAPRKLVAVVERQIGEKIPTGITNFQLMLRKAQYDADLGDEKARKFVTERTEGKVQQRIELEVDSDKIQAQLNISAENAPEPLSGTLSNGADNSSE